MTLFPHFLLMLAIAAVVFVAVEHVETAPQAPADDYPAVWREPARDRMVDSWQYGNRQCTSYAAWMLWNVHQYSAVEWGNARDWVDAAQNAAIRTTWEPLVHSVAVDTSFVPGHVMWVEAVNPDGTIRVSEYNYKPGEYSERTIDATGLTFIDVAGSRL